MQSLFARRNPHLLLALALALVYHGGLLFFTFKRTYDAYVHIFFADHYARFWFDPWDYRWYTGFTLTSYPPGSQQTIALLSNVVGLQNGFIIAQTFAILMVTIGMYRFSKIWVSEEAAGYAALLVVFASSIAETMHVFGQLPTMLSLGFLLNALAYAHRWLRDGDWKMLVAAWAFNAATTAAHHVTTLFGAVFFVGPVIVMSIIEDFRKPLPDEPPQHPDKITRKNARALIARRLRRIMPVTIRSAVYTPGLVVALVLVVLPYWLWSKADPITQMPIPHASRDSFIANPNAGLAFWIIPYGVALVALPYVFYKGLTTRAWPMTLSFAMLFLLGTGGTTPFPRMLLRGAYEIVTLDRFTFWATITMLPLLGELVVSLRHGGLSKYLREQFGKFIWYGALGGLVVCYLMMSLLTANFTQFRKIEPEPIDMQPIVNFLEKDQHWRWRYLTLGFGDQMAWLSAQTTATSVDGNYHSARRLPELTTTPVERLEGAKFRGIPGVGSLQQFLAVPDKYNLKFVFSNDQFYDPLLFFSGWHRLQRLENGTMVWEREDIPPLPEVLPRKDIPVYQKAMWGIVPIAAIITALIVMSAPVWWPSLRALFSFLGVPRLLRRLRPALSRLPIPRLRLPHVLPWIDGRLHRWSQLPEGARDSANGSWQLWKGWLARIPRPRPASPTARQVRTGLLVVIAVIGLAGVVFKFMGETREPLAIVRAYYDDLDFRRFSNAYARLDPKTRPSYDQYLLELSVINGLVASYGKLDSMQARILAGEPERVEVEANTVWVTSLAEYPTIQRLTLVKRSGQWYIMSRRGNMGIPPDQFFTQATVVWHSQGRRRVTTETTAFGDILDRPELQVLSARLVKVREHYSVVGELINVDANPADVTVTGALFDKDGQTLTTYNAQSAIMHKLFPKEVTPFRVDFEGVAGAVLSDTVTAGDFKPGAYSPVNITTTIAAFDVYAKGVATSHDLDRDVATQDLKVEIGTDGKPHLTGQLLNSGTKEATIPHMLITYYDSSNRVVWVDQVFIRDGIRPQRLQPFDVPITPIDKVTIVLDTGNLFANNLGTGLVSDPNWGERMKLSNGLGYSSLRVSVNYFIGGDQ